MARKKKPKNTSTNDQPVVEDQDRTLAVAFAKLAMTAGYKKKSKAYREAKDKFIAREFNNYFGMDTSLKSWQILCGDLGLDMELLSSITKCKKVRAAIWDEPISHRI